MAWGTASMALKITDTLWSRLAALLMVIALAGLSSGILVRELILKDFRSYMSGKMEDRSYWVMARLEGQYAEKGHWDQQELADDVVWAYMMGLAIKVTDAEKKPVIDVKQAVDLMSSPMKKRILAYAKGDVSVNFGSGIIYPLFYNGAEIGQLEVICANPDKDLVFVTRSNRLLLISLLVVGTLTMLLSIVLSRRITRPVEQLTAAARSLRDGDISVRVRQDGTREFRTMADTFNRMAVALTTQESLRKKLLSNAAHELRTPLTVMRLQVEQMADGMVPADNEHLVALMGEMDRFRRVLGALDDLSQAESSATNLKKQPLQIRKFLEPIVERFIITTQDVTFTLNVDDNLAVTADPDLLSQIMLNLITNSIKAIENQGIIVIRAERGNSGITISVKDSGCGIKEEDLPFIFQRFYRGFQKGMGVGLAIVKELVEAHGGKISATNNAEGGACFQIILPA